MVKGLSDCELATVLAALRQWQREFEFMDAVEVACSPHFEDHPPLGADEIDLLCERLNRGDHA